MTDVNLQPKSFASFFYIAVLLRLFQERLKPTETPKKSLAAENIEEFSRVRCPSCKWQPKASSRWYCGDCEYPEYFYNGCGAAWNTFATGGVCPGCHHQWRWTVCLSCYRWSRHEQWYDDTRGAVKSTS